VRFAFIRRRGKEFPVKLMCEVLGVSRSGYYDWAARPAGARAERAAGLKGQIRLAHEASRCTYGSPRVYRELEARGVAVCENTVARYMREEGLCATPRRRFVPRTTDSSHPHPVAPNVLGRDFAADGPDRKWGCDLTYLWTDQGWLYLSVVVDLFSRRVVGWSMSDDLKSAGVVDALAMALARRKPGPGLLHHSDRGVQYACGAYREMLEKNGVARSMSRPGNCYDNAVVESFFGTLKTELVHRRRYRTRAEARADVFEWIECWYNRRRRHSSLGYLSPEQFEAQLN
jgi:putative transposase